MYQCISIAHVDPAKVPAVLEAAKVLAKETRMQEGNLSYNVVRPEGREDVLIITEHWETQENFQAHVAHADEPGDLVFEFGKVMADASVAPPELYPCAVLL